MATAYKHTYKLTIKGKQAIKEGHTGSKKEFLDTGDREVIIKTLENVPTPKYVKVKNIAKDIAAQGEEVIHLALVEVEEYTV